MNDQTRGADIRLVHEIEFMKAALGGESKIQVEKDVTCPACNGSWSEKGSANTKCSDCGGRGYKLNSSGV